MTTLLPKDADDNIIPALRLRTPGGAHTLSATATSARNSTAFSPDTKVISLFATVPVFVRFGESTVTASTADHYFPAGVYYDIAISGGGTKGAQYTHMAVIRAETDGAVYLSEKE